VRWQGDAQPFLQADPPSAVRLSQTLGHASSLMRHMPGASSFILEAGLPFVALVAPGRETLVAAGASSSAHLLKLAAKVRSGCQPVGGYRTVTSVHTREGIEPHRSPHVLNRSAVLPVGFMASPWRSGFFPQYPAAGSAQASFVQLVSPALICFAIQIQSKAAAHRAWPNPSFKRTRLRRSA